jgi:hypothetical protein
MKTMGKGEVVETEESETSNSAPSGEGEEICGVKVDRVDLKRLLKYATTMKLTLSKVQKEDVEELIPAVVGHITAKMKDVPMLQCDRCGAVTPESLDFCPFCGEMNEPDEGEPSSVIGGNSEPDSPSVMAAAKTTETALAKREPSVMTTNAAKRAPKALAPATEDALEEAVGRIQALKREWEDNAWHIGQQLRVVSEETKDRPALWRLRKQPDGVTPLYDTFKAFLRAEVGISYRMAQTCMYVAKEYSSEQLQTLSTSKIEIILNAPEGERKKLLAEATTQPVRQLREKVRDLNIAAGKHENRRKARQERAKEEHAKKDEKEGVVTFTFPGKKKTVGLFRVRKDATGKLSPATSATDAWGWIEGTNGVQLVFKIVKTEEGRLKIAFEAKREE